MTSEESPTARALLTLELLQGNTSITADRLADKLGVSQRAARRYVGILREAGIPVLSERGPHGGYRLGRGLRLPPLVFSATEALGLVMAVLDGHHEAGDPTDPVGSALGKIVRALPEPVAAQAESVRRAVTPAPDRGAARPLAATTAAVVAACSQLTRIRIGYHAEHGPPREIEVDPWAVVVRHGRWYLLCHSHTSGGRRVYRLDRIASVCALAETFTPPAGLDPVSTVEEHLAEGWRYHAELVVDAPVEVVRRCLPRMAGRAEAIDAGTTRVVGSTNNPEWYAEQLALIPAGYRVVGGPEVREAARVLAERMLAAVR